MEKKTQKYTENSLFTKSDKYLMTLRSTRYETTGCGKRKQKIVCGM